MGVRLSPALLWCPGLCCWGGSSSQPLQPCPGPSDLDTTWSLCPILHTPCPILLRCLLAKVNGRPGEEKNFYHQFCIEKYSSLPRDTFKTYVERHVTRRKLSLKLIGYCRQSSYTDSEVVFTLLPAVAWVLKSQFAPGYMHFNKCFEGVSGKRGIFHNGKLAIEVFFLSRPAIDFS